MSGFSTRTLSPLSLDCLSCPRREDIRHELILHCSVFTYGRHWCRVIFLPFFNILHSLIRELELIILGCILLIVIGRSLEKRSSFVEFIRRLISTLGWVYESFFRLFERSLSLYITLITWLIYYIVTFDFRQGQCSFIPVTTDSSLRLTPHDLSFWRVHRLSSPLCP